MQAEVPLQARQPVVILALLQQQVHPVARLPEVQRVLDIQEEQCCKNALVWEAGERHSTALDHHGLLLRSRMGLLLCCCNQNDSAMLL